MVPSRGWPIDKWMLTIVAGASMSCRAGPIGMPPDTSWVAGEYSETDLEGDASFEVLRLSMSEDGQVLLYSVIGCGPAGTTTQAETYEWAVVEEDVVIFGLLGDDVLVSQIDCNTIELTRMSSGSSLGSWNRGEMCLAEISLGCPSGSECDPCETVWCEPPPPMCE